ncbi:MAG: fumarylacetoacetate hydrolase family protein [Sinobacteraceae bacterium]|nr:fumarylacetoacetate hydrolase family protein [Nevskiaceae bacterium]
MRLVTFSPPAGGQQVGVVSGDRVHALQTRISGFPSGMIEVLDELDKLRPLIMDLVARGKADYPLADVKLHAPIARPGKILGLGLNYRDHAVEAKMELPSQQLWFAKMSTAANGPFDPIQLPRVSDKLDYEAELAVVIGRRCRHVDRADADAVIAGYCVANDVSVRDWQLRTSQFTLGKSFDTHAPFGPWIVTADEVAHPQNLGIRCFVNGEQRQNSRTSAMTFDCQSMVEHLSQAMTLEPGDLLLTGTPAGVGALSNPPRYLIPGDIVRVEIDGIGAIENRVESEM